MSVVFPSPWIPSDELLKEKAPVLTEMLVPGGLLFAARVTEILVVKTWNPARVGDRTRETVATLVAKSPEIPLKF